MGVLHILPPPPKPSVAPCQKVFVENSKTIAVGTKVNATEAAPYTCIPESL